MRALLSLRSLNLIVFAAASGGIVLALAPTSGAEENRERDTRTRSETPAAPAAPEGPIGHSASVEQPGAPETLNPNIPVAEAGSAPTAATSPAYRLPPVLPATTRQPGWGKSFMANPQPKAPADPRRFAAGAPGTCASVAYRIWDMELDGVTEQPPPCDAEAGGIGTGEGCPIIWMVSYQVTPGNEQIASIIVAWDDVSMGMNAAELGLYADVSGASTPEDADPTDATLIYAMDVTVNQLAGTGISKYNIPEVDQPTLTVGDIFYVAAVYVPQSTGAEAFPCGSDSACSGDNCPTDTTDGLFYAGRSWIGVALDMQPVMQDTADGLLCENTSGTADCTQATNPTESICGIIGLIEDVGSSANQLSRNWVLGADSVPPVCGADGCNPQEAACNPDIPGELICPEDCGTPDPSETSCFDGLDNDCNGDIDCADTACPLVTDEVGACSDGLDNDCDVAPSFVAGGGTDCNDADCYDQVAACMFDCSMGAVAEGETVCADGNPATFDTFNAGCNIDPPNSFSWSTNLVAGGSVCGTSGNSLTECESNDDCGLGADPDDPADDETCNTGNGFCRAPCTMPEDCDDTPGGGEGTCEVDGFCTGGLTPVRDTDWYQVTNFSPNPNGQEWTACLTAEFPGIVGFALDEGGALCDDLTALTGAVQADAYEEICTSICATPNQTMSVFVSVPAGWNPNTDERYPCGREYEVTLTQTDCLAGASACGDFETDLNCQFPNQEFNSPLADEAPPGTGFGFASIFSDDNPFELETTQKVADSFSVIGNTDISEVCWWGTYKDLFGVDSTCDPEDVPSDNFTVTYYNNDNAGDEPLPGTLRAGPFAVTPSVIPTGLLLGSQPELDEYSFSATHAPVSVTAGECLWVEIRNDTTGSNCHWEWSTAPSATYGNGFNGDGVCAIKSPASDPYVDGDAFPFDMAWCLGPEQDVIGNLGCIFTGACCDDELEDCSENTPFTDCAGAAAFDFERINRYSESNCASFDPPCGQGGGDTCPGGSALECPADACTWCECVAGVCNCVSKGVQADLGGGNGACPIDQACDGNDNFHALNCFSNSDTTNTTTYPCEDTTPTPVANVDAGGSNGSCVRDNTCDGNDAFAALNCFSNSNTTNDGPYPCVCGGPAPQAPSGERVRRVRPTTGVTLRAPASARAGDLVAVEVHLDGALKALRGYQLHVGVGGGNGGALELVDIAVDDERSDYIFAGAPATWMAFNRSTDQVVVGMNPPDGVQTAARGYLATFTYRVPSNAAGTYVVDLRYDGQSALPVDRTFLFGSYAASIDVSAITPAEIVVESGRRTERLGMK